MLLVKPTIDLRKEYIDYYNEWKNSGEESIPWLVESVPPHDFECMIKTLNEYENGLNIPIKWLPSNSTYWAVDENNKIISVVNIRHRLTQKLFDFGGHIGYGVCPSQRGKGLSKKVFNLSLKKANDLGIDKVLAVCHDNNIASRKTLISCGGLEDSYRIDENKNLLRRFWFVKGGGLI